MAPAHDWLHTLIEDSHVVLKSEDHSNLESVKRTQDYLRSRNVTESDLRDHQIGLALPSLVNLPACSPGFDEWARRFLWNNIVFPLYSPHGFPIGIQTYCFNPTINTRPYQQYYLYPEILFPYLFGLPRSINSIFETGTAVVVEGVFDYFAVNKLVPYAIAQLTAGTPRSAFRFYKRFCTTVVMLTDMDEPGREACYRLATENVDRGFAVCSPPYSEKDPGAMFLKGKTEELRNILVGSGAFHS